MGVAEDLLAGEEDAFGLAGTLEVVVGGTGAGAAAYSSSCLLAQLAPLQEDNGDRTEGNEIVKKKKGKKKKKKKKKKVTELIIFAGWYTNY